MAKVLVVDDQRAVCTALEVLFLRHGIEVVSAHGPEQALDIVRREDIGVVVQDMNFTRDTTSGGEGQELMRALRALEPTLPIILMTAFTSLPMAVALVKEGATDYIAKPWDDTRLVTSIKNLLRLRALEQENERHWAARARLRSQLVERYDLRGITYFSAEMHETVALAVRVAAADVPVLITGPNGAGKERIAEVVQANSRRKGKPFVRVNAGALPDSLLEAELFGAEPGAYTGAARTRIGRFEEANGGTLLLDEIGNLSLSGQAKLLRVLQTGEFQRLGSGTLRKSDVRILSATNADLPAAIQRGAFREDLYFRLNTIEIAVPPLRSRPDDILGLAAHFLEAKREPGEIDDSPVTLSEEAKNALLAHDWPGNVRELENRIRRARLVRRSQRIEAVDLGLAAGRPEKRPSSEVPGASVPPPAEAASPPPAEQGAPGQLEEERRQIERVLVEAGGVVSRAAALLGMSRQGFYRRMERLGIALERRPKIM